ncbi:unnamed protein product [Alopecurus aequalis]
MDPSKPSAATTSNSTSDADLASCFLAMRLGPQDVETFLQQQRRAALAPPPAREQRHLRHEATLQHEALASSLAPFQVTMNPMMLGLQSARQFWPQAQNGSQHQFDPWSSAQLQPYYSSAQSGSQHQSDPWSSAQQQPCTLSASASQYQPQAVVTASQYHYQPQAVVTASQYQYQPQAAVMASQYQPEAVVTASQYQQSGDAPDYGSSFHQRMRAIQAAQAQRMPLRERLCRTLEETRSVLLSGSPMELQLVTLPDSAAHVVHLLLQNHAEGVENYERILQSVLSGVTRRVHDFIDNKEGHEVFVALLLACTGRHAEVDAIVKAAVAPSPNGRNSLLRSAKPDYYWESCVMQLMTAASPYPDLRAKVVDRLMCEGLLVHDRADQLLDHCFATTQHEDTVIVVQCALDKFDDMIHKSSGCKCLVECYDRGTGHQIRAFNDILIRRTTEIATGQFSNYFMQHVLEHGDGETRRLLAERLMAGVAKLSLDPIGSYVVEACYQKAGLLPRVLAAFLHLDKACLVELVQGMYSNYVVHKLLDTAIDRFPRETMELARRIDALPLDVKVQPYATKVMRVVKKLFTRYGRIVDRYTRVD